MTVASNLFRPLKVGRSQLSHRIAMAPLTRLRADDAHVPLPSLVPEYYAQRACVPGTLLVTEATFIAPQAGGMPNVPGIWSEPQVDAWRRVTDAVHARGGVVYLQLWALGRAADPDALRADLGAGAGARVVGAGDVPFEGGAVPAPLAEAEIWEYVGLYAQAARNAVAAGFDGVEVHGANGYLIDQFLQDRSNNRADAWGGSVEGRARFALEVVRAVAAAVGADRVGLRLSPFSTFQGMGMADPVPQFAHLVRELRGLGLAYLHLVESRVSGNADVEGTEKVDFLLDLWAGQGPVFLAGGFTPDSARRAVDEEYPDKDVVVVFGRHFISNPDLVFRIEKGIELTPYDRDSFYIPKSPQGYITYPFSKEFQESRVE